MVVAHHERATLRVGGVFLDGDEVTGVLDWSEAAGGDAAYDLASLTLGHPERLGDLVAGHGGSSRCSTACADPPALIHPR
ncbi:hypothetical protein Amir_3850 [Actinosynnema mirum DSM 43827]|uniref:Aminoglycoside phosphotransferase domain-containing protein n=1 Tax=Actinosynnema mirum (strain ATCC 29888 / DSM 43827 / JCM 3225 / NBRC 14064 / NCIMB 13271 / NRRL B-12336 / IMRU 3971 / 101) TaxID=446462 RepID=C6WEC9_ACTMD|nr:hypothetical protein Amir_3850 [Actinosynnema mirum DSM 43827]